MTQPANHRSLTPQFRFSSGTLRNFLRLSRSSVDDSITQNLNALVTPAEGGFDPRSTSRRAWVPPSRQISSETCQSFKDKVLFPAWQARTDVLDYCGLVATSPDPDDPEAMLRKMENQRDRERVVNERLDPYSGRFFPREARKQTLAMLIRQERDVESVVRSRTWDVVQRRCASSSESWEDAVGQWHDAQAPSATSGSRM
ncbi:hypothetical protein G6O67_006357 [Ophiocordyceps sinensis]|nr:hypothetical protein G6O67_006357 [Ophiocordyceps sinensis]